MNDAWLGVLLAFGVTFAVMTVVNHFFLHFGTTASVVFALVWAVVVAGTTAWRERR